MNLEIISLVIQAIETLAVVIALVYGWLQVRDSRKNLKIESVWEIYRELSEENVRSSRKYIYQHKSRYASLIPNGSNLNILDKDDWHHANIVSNSFDRVGFLVVQGLIPVELLEGFKYVIGRSWIILEPFVIANRNARNEPSFQSYFEELANMILAKYVSRDDIKAVTYVIAEEEDKLPNEGVN